MLVEKSISHIKCLIVMIRPIDIIERTRRGRFTLITFGKERRNLARTFLLTSMFTTDDIIRSLFEIPI